jgi:hypothetical protein
MILDAVKPSSNIIVDTSCLVVVSQMSKCRPASSRTSNWEPKGSKEVKRPSNGPLSRAI